MSPDRRKEPALSLKEEEVLSKIDTWQPTTHVIGPHTYYRVDEVQSFIERYKRLRIAYGRLKK